MTGVPFLEAEKPAAFYLCPEHLALLGYDLSKNWLQSMEVAEPWEAGVCLPRAPGVTDNLSAGKQTGPQLGPTYALQVV
jgi:hypothetical protein